MEIEAFLRESKIQFAAFEHSAVLTCEDARRECADIPGTPTKNLFLRDKKGVRHFLVVLPELKSVSIADICAVLEADKLSFGSPERLKRCLGIEPGAVSLLALVNDREKHVELIIDEDLLTAAALQCHPLRNTATLVLDKSAWTAFLAATGRTPRVLRFGPSNGG